MKCRRCYAPPRDGSDYCAACAAEVSQNPIPHVPHLRARLETLEAENAQLKARLGDAAHALMRLEPGGLGGVLWRELEAMGWSGWYEMPPKREELR